MLTSILNYKLLLYFPGYKLLRSISRTSLRLKKSVTYGSSKYWYMILQCPLAAVDVK